MLIKCKLLVLWLGFYALLIVPLRYEVYIEQRIASLEGQLTWNNARWLDCVDAQRMQRLYFGRYDWVDFKCIVVTDNMSRWRNW